MPFWPNSPGNSKHPHSVMLKAVIKKCRPSTIIPSASITNGDETSSSSNPSESSLLHSAGAVLSLNIPWPTSGFRRRQCTLFLHKKAVWDGCCNTVGGLGGEGNCQRKSGADPLEFEVDSVSSVSKTAAICAGLPVILMSWRWCFILQRLKWYLERFVTDIGFRQFKCSI